MSFFKPFNQTYRWLFAELAVVVVGILLALQVDQWRTESSERADEAAILKSLLSDLNFESDTLSAARERVTVQRDGSVALTEYLLSDQPRSEERIRTEFRDAIFSLGWRPVSGTYKSLLGSGELRLISDAALRDALVAYYEEIQPFIGSQIHRAQTMTDRLIDTAAPDIYRIVVGEQPARNFSEAEIVVVQPLGDIPRNPELIFALGSHALTHGSLVRATSDGEDSVDRLRDRVARHLESLQ